MRIVIRVCIYGKKYACTCCCTIQPIACRMLTYCYMPCIIEPPDNMHRRLFCTKNFKSKEEVGEHMKKVHAQSLVKPANKTITTHHKHKLTNQQIQSQQHNKNKHIVQKIAHKTKPITSTTQQKLIDTKAEKVGSQDVENTNKIKESKLETRKTQSSLNKPSTQIKPQTNKPLHIKMLSTATATAIINKPIIQSANTTTKPQQQKQQQIQHTHTDAIIQQQQSTVNTDRVAKLAYMKSLLDSRICEGVANKRRKVHDECQEIIDILQNAKSDIYSYVDLLED